MIVLDLLTRLSISYSAQDSDAIMQRASFHSKDGGASFGGEPQGCALHAGATLAAAYAQLKQLRLAAGKVDDHAA